MLKDGYCFSKVYIATGYTDLRKGIEGLACMVKMQLDMYEERCAIVRETIGPKVDLLIECHSQFDAPGAVKLAQRIEKYNIYFMEEPNTPQAHLKVKPKLLLAYLVI